jgi:hypothetical protein
MIYVSPHNEGSKLKLQETRNNEFFHEHSQKNKIHKKNVIESL